MADNQQGGKPTPRRSWFQRLLGRSGGTGVPAAAPVADLGALPEIRAARPRFFRVREKITPVWRWSLAVIPLVVFLAWWLWVTAGAEPESRRMSAFTLPNPYEVVARFPSLWYDSALMRNILLSLARVLGGFTVAVFIAVPLGILMASFSRIGATFSLVGTLLSYLPLPAMVPLTMVWWGTGEGHKVGYLALATFAFLLPMVVRIVGLVDHKYLLSAYAQGATAWQSVNRVLVPIAMPDIFNAVRLCLGVGWTYIILVEIIRSDEGLGGVGNLIEVFRRRGLMGEIYLTVAAIMLVGAVLDRGCAWVSAQLFPYRGTLGEQGARPRRAR